jgi:hypothetical protein
MKRIIILISFIISTLVIKAQNDATMFLGIPMQGTKSSMIEKLEKKGFTYNSQKDQLIGWFNDEKVFVKIITKNNKIVEITVTDFNDRSRFEIIKRFNTLVNQFSTNKNYSFSFGNQRITNNNEPMGKSAVFFQKGKKYNLPDGNKRVLIEIRKLNNINPFANPLYYIVMHYENNYNKSNGSDL